MPMKMKLSSNERPENPLQSPFRQERLLSQSGFISFCNDNNATTDKEELEYFEKEGVLFPAVMVNRGYGKVWLIKPDSSHKDAGKFTWGSGIDDLRNLGLLDDATYYMADSIYTGNPSWLNDYDLLFPVEVADSVSLRYEIPADEIVSSTVVSDPRQLGNLWEPFYSPTRLYELKKIKNLRTITISNAALFTLNERSGKKLASFFSGNEILKKTVASSYAIAAAVIQIDWLFTETEDEIITNIKLRHEFLNGNWSEINGEISTFRELNISRWKELASEIIDEFDLRLDILSDLRREFAVQGSFGSGTRFAPYLVTQTEYILSDTEDAYRIASMLNWFIELVYDENITLAGIIMGASNYCPYCRKAFEPKKRSQKTCGSKECKAARVKKTQKEGYRQGNSHYRPKTK